MNDDEDVPRIGAALTPTAIGEKKNQPVSPVAGFQKRVVSSNAPENPTLLANRFEKEALLNSSGSQKPRLHALSLDLCSSNVFATSKLSTRSEKNSMLQKNTTIPESSRVPPSSTENSTLTNGEYDNGLPAAGKSLLLSVLNNSAACTLTDKKPSSLKNANSQFAPPIAVLSQTQQQNALVGAPMRARVSITNTAAPITKIPVSDMPRDPPKGYFFYCCFRA